MRLAALVDDPHVSAVDSRQAGITRAAAFVEQQVMLLGPRATVVEADLDRVMRADFLRVRVGEQQQRTRSLLERMGILPLSARYPDQISGGEARRVALARALAPRPATLLFDEPLTNLDRTLREDLLLLIIESVTETGSRMLYVTHDEYEAERIDGTIIRFDNGTICRDGI